MNNCNAGTNLNQGNVGTLNSEMEKEMKDDGSASHLLVFDRNSSVVIKDPVSLQDAFMKYKKIRQFKRHWSKSNDKRASSEWKHQCISFNYQNGVPPAPGRRELKKCRKRKEVKNEVMLRALADPNKMWNLRMKFLDQFKKYYGVPYGKKYWKPDEPEYSSKIFLDCCGLIRRVMRDLEKDFGFRIGPWNQGYMYDTLPITLEEKDMKPGDLVFISATYYNTKMRKQAHKMTHVEIWLGDGPKTIGSRWHRGHVQIFDNYAFEAKSYHSETYHFKSIDTWLMGICRSHCKEHTWKTRADKFKPGKKSIFSIKDKQIQQQQDECDEAASDTEADDVQRSASVVQNNKSSKKTTEVQNKGSEKVRSKSTPPKVNQSEDEMSNKDDDLQESDIMCSDTGSDVSSLRSSELSLLNARYLESDSPNSKKDFAKNPCEGKETDSSQMKKVIKSVSCNKDNEMSENKGLLLDTSSGLWIPDISHLSDHMQIGSDSDKMSTASSGNKTPRDVSSIFMTFDSECQTGVTADGTCFHTLGEDKWSGATNVLCYASMYRGEAAVQIKTPDLIPVDSSSDSDSGEGYSAQEQYSTSDDPEQCGSRAEKENSKHNKDNVEQSNEGNGDLKGEDTDDLVSVSGCSMYPRVGSAISQRSFAIPQAVGPLYTGFTQESSSSSAAESSDNKGAI